MRSSAAFPIVTLAIGIIVAGLSSDTEQPRKGQGREVLHIGYLCTYDSAWGGFVPFLERLEELGYVTDQSIPSDHRQRIKIDFGEPASLACGD